MPPSQQSSTSKSDNFDYAAAKTYLQQKQEQLKAQRFRLWQQAEKDTSEIIAMIISKYSPQKIIQWGSVLDSTQFSEMSDIDLAVAGIESVAFLQMLADAEKITNFSLDLIRWENIDQCFQKIILMKGKIVYEK
jgi:predicted nucleotidyltransferase